MNFIVFCFALIIGLGWSSVAQAEADVASTEAGIFYDLCSRATAHDHGPCPQGELDCNTNPSVAEDETLPTSNSDDTR